MFPRHRRLHATVSSIFVWDARHPVRLPTAAVQTCYRHRSSAAGGRAAMDCHRAAELARREAGNYQGRLQTAAEPTALTAQQEPSASSAVDLYCSCSSICRSVLQLQLNCRSVLHLQLCTAVMYYSYALQLCTTALYCSSALQLCKYYSSLLQLCSTALYFSSVLCTAQYYGSVLQLCTTALYYSSVIQFYNTALYYSSVLHLCTRAL